MALEDYEAGLCPCGCGYPVSVSQAAENEDRFGMDLPIRCHARTAMIREMDKQGDDVPAPGALMWERPKLKT